MVKCMSMELSPIDGRKSFYGKARITYSGLPYVSLVSYDTTVCSLDLETNRFIRHWNGYSATTMRHVNAFRHYYGLPLLSKSEWLSIQPGIPV